MTIRKGLGFWFSQMRRTRLPRQEDFLLSTFFFAIPQLIFFRAGCPAAFARARQAGFLKGMSGDESASPNRAGRAAGVRKKRRQGLICHHRANCGARVRQGKRRDLKGRMGFGVR
ncbi:MAG: hypothetical protein FWD68_08315 [Alphaproteobacteria bacterium]|nr:hypothetical protein [Alphaproteobacteria bacterium]